jgi:hypothetical protein
MSVFRRERHQLVNRRLFGAEGATAPNWVTVTVWPPTVTVALREDVVVLAVAVTVTVPLPDPLAPLAIDSHDELSVAVHVQPVATVTVTMLLPPAAAIVDPAASATVQDTPS